MEPKLVINHEVEAVTKRQYDRMKKAGSFQERYEYTLLGDFNIYVGNEPANMVMSFKFGDDEVFIGNEDKEVQ